MTVKRCTADVVH